MLKIPLLSIVAAVVVLAQPPEARPSFEEFEVATILPTAPAWTGGRFIRMQSANRLVARNHALKTLIAAAYNLSPKAITGGPPWEDSDRYDILAKTPGDVRPNLEEQMTMLRKLLSERFKLTFHREPKELSIYTLSIGKNGPKLRESAATANPSPAGPSPLIFIVSPQIVELPAHNASMDELASVLQRSALDRPVLDKTGLAGRYDFDLEWTPDETQFGGALGKPANPDGSTVPGLFAALQQQLGLRLESKKGPVELLVIDGIGRPTEN